MTRAALRIDMQLDGHQAAGLVADGPGPVTLSSAGFGAALVFAKRELARPLFDADAVHALDPPTPGQHDDPLRRRILMPVAHPPNRLHGEDNGRFAALHLVVPLRIGGAHRLEFVMGEHALRLMTDAIGIDIEMRIGDAGLRPRIAGSINHWNTP